MSLHSVAVVYRKELTEALRDRRTLISTIVVPLLLFPILSVGFASVATLLVGKAKEESAKVMILGGSDSPTVVAELKNVEKIDIVPAAANWKDQVINKEVRAVVDIPARLRNQLGRAKTEATVEIYTYGGELKSKIAYGGQNRKTFERLPRHHRQRAPRCKESTGDGIDALRGQAAKRRSARKSRRRRNRRLNRLYGHPLVHDRRDVSRHGFDRR